MFVNFVALLYWDRQICPEPLVDYISPLKTGWPDGGPLTTAVHFHITSLSSSWMIGVNSGLQPRLMLLSIDPSSHATAALLSSET